MPEQTLLQKQSQFLSNYTSYFSSVGAHTSRVIRCTKRIGASLGLEVHITMLPRTAVLYAKNPETGETCSQISDLPKYAPNFSKNEKLGDMSWHAYDGRLSFDQCVRLFERYQKQKPIVFPIMLFLVSLANASFCRLFNGDAMAMLIVAVATAIGFSIKHYLARSGANHLAIALISAFIASIISTVAFHLPTATPETALATSVLYLIPGVPLLTGVVDIVAGYPLIGIARLSGALQLVICIALGLTLTLLLLSIGGVA
ncbi:MAG: threonine/serine exporter family protein [Fibrobacter sp.]|nr:threonine/serine exporter family protein [Fibrobacter sp.]